MTIDEFDGDLRACATYATRVTQMLSSCYEFRIAIRHTSLEKAEIKKKEIWCNSFYLMLKMNTENIPLLKG